MKKISREEYEAWSWLPIKDWNVDKMMGPTLEAKVFCKLCDEYVPRGQSGNHLDRHIKQRKRQIADDRRKAKLLRAENLRKAREAKMAGELEAKKESQNLY